MSIRNREQRTHHLETSNVNARVRIDLGGDAPVVTSATVTAAPATGTWATTITIYAGADGTGPIAGLAKPLTAAAPFAAFTPDELRGVRYLWAVNQAGTPDAAGTLVRLAVTLDRDVPDSYAGPAPSPTPSFAPPFTTPQI